jgi:PTH2 family peptidyl-tRNA hydrolase
MSEVKQVIVIRKDLNMRKGKACAQASHASMAVLLDAMNKSQRTDHVEMPRGYMPYIKYIRHMEFEENSYWDKWLNGRFTKICVSCKDEAELLKLHLAAKDANIPTALITDAGFTEFDGVPTNTCIAIGPYWSEEIDKITGNLKLL